MTGRGRALAVAAGVLGVASVARAAAPVVVVVVGAAGTAIVVTAAIEALLAVAVLVIVISLVRELIDSIRRWWNRKKLVSKTCTLIADAADMCIYSCTYLYSDGSHTTQIEHQPKHKLTHALGEEMMAGGCPDSYQIRF